MDWRAERGTKRRRVLERGSGGVRKRPLVVEEGVGEGEVEGGEAFEDFFVAEGEAEPDAVAAGAGGEGEAADALGIELCRRG